MARNLRTLEQVMDEILSSDEDNVIKDDYGHVVTLNQSRIVAVVVM